TTYAYYQSRGRSNGLLQSVTDANNNVTSYGYDANRRVTTQIEGYGSAVPATTVYAYDAAGNLKSVTDANGNVTSTSYDAARRVTTVVEGVGTAVASTGTYLYDAAGNVLSETSGYSATASYSHPSVTSYAYDALNRATTVITAYGTS